MGTFSDWISSRAAVAQRLSDGQCGGTYAEAILITSSLISGMAADLWPGDRIDRFRFVEFWARFAHPELNANLISLPLLLDTLRGSDRPTEAEAVRLLRPEAFNPLGIPEARVVTGETADAAEEKLGSTIGFCEKSGTSGRSTSLCF